MQNRVNNKGMLGRAYQWLMLLALGALLAACGGGGGDPTIDGGSGSGNGGTPAVATTLKLSLLGASGQSSNALSTTAPLTAQALVLDAGGLPVSNVLVAFTSDATLVTLSPTNGSALTDAKGIASVTLSAFNASVSGAGKVTASTTPAGTSATPITGEATFVVTAAQSTGARIALSLLSGATPSNTLSSATPLTAEAVVTDLSGKPIGGALVQFATNNQLAVMSSSTGTALTDTNGTASVVLRPFSLSASGAASLQVSTTVNGATTSGQVNYVLGATELVPANMRFSPDRIPAYGTINITVDVMAGTSLYTTAGSTVDFSSNCVILGKATVTSNVPAINGKATAVYRDLGCNRDGDMVNATVTGSDITLHQTMGVGTLSPASVQFSAVSPSDKSLVIRGQGGLSRTETATLTFRVVDIFGKALAGQEVTFSLVNGPEMTLNKDRDVTDANGEVITTVNSGTTPTTFRVKASLASGVSTMSDSVVVSTGRPVQAAFSISVDRPNVEGWTYDSDVASPATRVRVLLADQAGNPVADGTPVAFQSTLGAIGSSSIGGCTTMNGGCAVDFRAQEPRKIPSTAITPCGAEATPRKGMAIICASTSDGTNTLFKKIAVFLSGSRVSKATLFYEKNENKPKPLDGSTYDLGEIFASNALQFSVQLSDENGNPMPSGSTVAIANMINGTGSVAANSIQNVFPHNLAGVDDREGGNVQDDQGTRHAVTINSLTPTTCEKAVDSTFNVTVTTPLGNITSFPFKLRFTCP